MRKVFAVVVNCRLKRSVVLHDTFHGFRTGRRTGTAMLEANLDQHLERLAHEPIFQVFLDAQKAYDSLDWERCLELMRGYRMGPNPARLPEN